MHTAVVDFFLQRPTAATRGTNTFELKRFFQ